MDNYWDLKMFTLEQLHQTLQSSSPVRRPMHVQAKSETAPPPSTPSTPYPPRKQTKTHAHLHLLSASLLPHREVNWIPANQILLVASHDKTPLGWLGQLGQIISKVFCLEANVTNNKIIS